MMQATIPFAATIGEIARQVGCPVHRIEYVIRTRNLRPKERAGNIRVFSEADVQFIASEIRRIDAEKGGGDGNC